MFGTLRVLPRLRLTTQSVEATPGRAELLLRLKGVPFFLTLSFKMLSAMNPKHGRVHAPA